MLEDPSANLPIRVLSSPDDTSFVLNYLRNHYLDFEIITRNYQKEIDLYKSEGVLHSTDPFERYLSFDEIRELLNGLARLPNITLSTIGHSVMGREIQMLEINAHPRKKRSMIIECGIHSREWITHATCLNFARNMIKYPCKAMDEFSLFILPVTNPDGYVFTFEGNRLHRKNW
ncbi:carboxypeptidase B-like [Brevipalpus obovatus]|uniref:carboxypeptidase B-like n=1 Tax=Brevipalpus obovatus TaxID=246614 RepID=UPI003D9F2ED0